MDFGNQYLTYKEYLKLGGKAIDQTSFNLLEIETRKKIDERTQGRLMNVDDVPDEVRFCVYSLINIVSGYINKNNVDKNIASESTDGYSVSYITGSQVKEAIIAKNAEIQDVISTMLYGVVVNGECLLYLGVKNAY